MNCIGPWAPAVLLLRIRLKPVSTRFTAASTRRETPKRRSARR